MRLALLAWLLVVMVGDFRWRRVPNVTVAAGIVLAMAAWWPGLQPFGLSVLQSLSGGAAAFAVLLAFYIFRWMGGGDVKYGAALGLWFGAVDFLTIWIIASLLAAIHAMLWMARSRIPMPIWTIDFLSGYSDRYRSDMSIEEKNNNKPVRLKERPIPYAAYLSIGAFAWMVSR